MLRRSAMPSRCCAGAAPCRGLSVEEDVWSWARSRRAGLLPRGYGARPWQKSWASSSQGLAAREHRVNGGSRQPSTIPRVTASTGYVRTLLSTARGGRCVERRQSTFEPRPGVADLFADAVVAVLAVGTKDNLGAGSGLVRSGGGFGAE